MKLSMIWNLRSCRWQEDILRRLQWNVSKPVKRTELETQARTLYKIWIMPRGTKEYIYMVFVPSSWPRDPEILEISRVTEVSLLC